ncbi:hypothetical protein [Actinokineospora globicatena]|uniref:hypothetical protein n=1 Tax=Actinokineospora globicatena TaxID=103729 RepID=UPI0020A2873A|nr:hypothetical protein [Actinokineospora globicatena]MCP2301530.1 hypothetical protein [Actinokineospora globicatena]GLW76823.1 hypothetical protein Aglo01_13050 [Actinokineospora globicatena]GLW83656.1 hypothetical protein Aglo02_12960 [Actinokineospora globicatena]
MYIDEGPGAPLSAIGRAMNDFAGNAASGRFAVNERGGEALLAAIRNMAAWVDSQSNRLRALAQTPQLGTSNNAQVMKPYMQQVAVDDQGFLTQLTSFRESLVKAEEGIKQAMANYRQTDDENAIRY